MARVRIINGTIANGVAVLTGDVIDVDRKTAQTLFANGKALPAYDKEESPKPVTRPAKKTATKKAKAIK